MLRRITLALLIAAAPSLGYAQSYGTSQFDKVITPSIVLGGFTLTGVGTVAGTLAAGNDSRIVGAAQNASAAITGGTINGTAIGGVAPASGAFTALTAASLSGLTTPLSAAQGGTGYTGVSAALDGLFSSTQGSVLYRGASAWQALPPGASGQVFTSGGTGANPAWATPSAGAAGTVMQPQGRLTLTSGLPTLTSTVTAATSVLYTPAVGNLVPIWTGSAFAMTAFTETTQALSDATKSPSAAAASQVYDLFAWSDGGTIRVTRGPAWGAGTSGSNLVRGTGTGSTALTRANGLLVNANAITNGPAAGYGTYVGTVATDSGGATVTFNTGTAATGGGAATIGLWNAYNRVVVRGQVRDSSATDWSYGAAAWRAANGSATARVTFVTGLAEDAWRADYDAIGYFNTTSYSTVGLGLNTTTAPTGITGYLNANNVPSLAAGHAVVQTLGANYLSAIEYVAGGTTKFIAGSTTGVQPGLTWEGRY